MNEASHLNTQAATTAAPLQITDNDSGSEIIWKCPNCGWSNIDDKALTAIPMCFRCQRDVVWSTITHGKIVSKLETFDEKREHENDLRYESRVDYESWQRDGCDGREDE